MSNTQSICKNCAHWLPHKVTDGPKRHGTYTVELDGICIIIDLGVRSIPEYETEAYETRADFGCIMFKSK